MDNFIITSGHRVGSRWLHYLLADVYGKQVSPEIDVSKIILRKRSIIRYLKNNRIPKFHGASFNDIADNITPVNYKIIGVVRDPRDRVVSFTFHNRYHNKTDFRQKKFNTDLEAVAYTVQKDKIFWFEEIQQAEIMIRGLSTINVDNNKTNFIWTTYEWMNENIKKEVKAIIKFIGGNIDEPVLEKHLSKHSFKNKSGRDIGQEKREDNWRRKGIVGDWKNWLSEDMIEKLQPAVDLYESKILEESLL